VARVLRLTLLVPERNFVGTATSYDFADVVDAALSGTMSGAAANLLRRAND
jgi:hypothetical protein